MMKTFCAAFLLCSLPGVALAQTAERPNVVVILADDMGFSDFSSYGGEIPTPHIDALANNGVRFTQFYNSARCSPTRAALLTGLNPHQAGMGYLSGTRKSNSRGTLGRLHERSVTVAQVLQGAGYFTSMTGKWHLGNSPQSTAATRGFDRSLSAIAGGIYSAEQRFRTDRGQPAQRRHLLLNGKRVELDDPTLGPPGWYGTDLWTDWGIRYIEEARSQKKPFFLYLAHVAPHFPLMAPQADINRFVGTYRDGWEKLRQARFTRQQRMGLIGPNKGLTKELDSADDWDDLSAQEKARYDRMMAIYAATIFRLDQSVGRLVAHLKAKGQFDNTLILILSDNGGNAESGPRGRTGDAPWGGPTSNVWTGMNWAQLQNTPFRYFKHFTQEGGIATPLIVHWPKGMARQRVGALERSPGHVIDVMPTILAATGSAYPVQHNGHAILPMEGTNLLPLLKGGSITRDKPMFWEHEGNRAVRDGRWKAVKRLGYPWQLFDMDTDRTEMKDLAAAQPLRVKAMSGQWDDWAVRTFVDPWTDDARRTDWGAPLNAARGESRRAKEGGRERRRDRRPKGVGRRE